MASPYESKLMVAENALETFIAGKMTHQQLEETLGKALTAANFNGKNKKFQVIVPKKYNSGTECFGIVIFPAVNRMEAMAEAAAGFQPIKTLKAMWAECDEWVIEIDPRMFDQSIISLNHKELLACLLHEIGHSVFSDKVTERFMRSMQGMTVRMSAADKAVIKAGYTLFMLPLATACFGISLGRSMSGGRLGEEKYADNFAVKCGYGEALLSALDKILAAFGTKDAKTAEVQANKEIDAEMKWSVTITKDVTARRNNLAKNLMSKAIATPSVYNKAVVGDVMSNTGVEVTERYDGGVMESFLPVLMLDEKAVEAYAADTNSEKFAMWDSHLEAARTQSRFIPGTPAFESILRQKVKKGLPSQDEVDELDQAVFKIRNQVDRDLVLDRIYDLMDEINEFMEYVESKPEMAAKYKPQADRLMQQLEAYRDAALKKNVRIGGNTSSSGTSKNNRVPSAQVMMRTGDYSGIANM